MAGKTGMQGKILKYLIDRPGQLLFRQDIAEDLGYTANQVSSTMYSLCNNKQTADVITKVAPECWKYDPTRKSGENGQRAPEATEAAPSPVRTGQAAMTRTTPARMFEQITETKDGELLIKDDSGELYLARRIG